MADSQNGPQEPRSVSVASSGVQDPNGAQGANLTDEQREGLRRWIRRYPLMADVDFVDRLITAVESIVREHRAEAWDEGANAAVEPVSTGTRMTLRAVIPFPANPYRGADHA